MTSKLTKYARSLRKNSTKAEALLWRKIRSRQREGIKFRRHGKPVAALVQPQDLDNLVRLRKAGPEGGLSSVSGGWEGSEDLVLPVTYYENKSR